MKRLNLHTSNFILSPWIGGGPGWGCGIGLIGPGVGVGSGIVPGLGGSAGLGGGEGVGVHGTVGSGCGWTGIGISNRIVITFPLFRQSEVQCTCPTKIHRIKGLK